MSKYKRSLCKKNLAKIAKGALTLGNLLARAQKKLYNYIEKGVPYDRYCIFEK